MFEAAEDAIVAVDDAERHETRSAFGEAGDSGTVSSVSSEHPWEVIATALRAITTELQLLEEYFIKAAGSVDIGDFKIGEKQKLIDLYTELNKLAQVFGIGYNSRKLESRRDFENELKTLKDEFVFMLRRLPPSTRMSLGAPELISEQLEVATGVIRDVKRILIAYFSKELCGRDILEQVAAIILYLFDTLSDWNVALYHLRTFEANSKTEEDAWAPLVNFVLIVVFIHFSAFRTASTYLSSRLLVPVYTIMPLLPVQVLTRQLYMCFKFKRKPNEIRFKEMIRYHSLREDSVFIYSSEVLPRALPQLILQGGTLLNIFFRRESPSSSLGDLIFSWITCLLNLCYACSRRSFFEFMDSSRFVSPSYFAFFMCYEFSRVVSSIMLFLCTPWWFGTLVCLVKFQVSLVWLCKRINSSYNVHLSFIRRIVSSLKGSVILTSIPMLCCWSGFPQFWMNALDVFGCLTLSALGALLADPPLPYNGVVSLVAFVIMSWFLACIIAWNSASLSRVFFGGSTEEML